MASRPLPRARRVEEEDKLFLAGRSTGAPSSLPESCRELLLLL